MENSGLTAFEFAILCCLLFCFLVIIDIPSLSKYFLTTGISAATNSFFLFVSCFSPLLVTYEYLFVEAKCHVTKCFLSFPCI